MVRRNAAVNRGSKYEHRNVIGYLDGLKSFDHKALYDFYKTWYRPEYQAIVVVGDIDVDRIENKDQNPDGGYSGFPSQMPRRKQAYLVPENEEPIVSIFSDPEMTASVMRLFIKRPALPKQYNNLIISQMYDVLNSYTSVMANDRMNESPCIRRSILSAGMDSGNILGVNPTQDLTMVAVQTRDGELLRGYKAILEEMEKMKRTALRRANSIVRKLNSCVRPRLPMPIGTTLRTDNMFKPTWRITRKIPPWRMQKRSTTSTNNTSKH